MATAEPLNLLRIKTCVLRIYFYVIFYWQYYVLNLSLAQWYSAGLQVG